MKRCLLLFCCCFYVCLCVEGLQVQWRKGYQPSWSCQYAADRQGNHVGVGRIQPSPACGCRQSGLSRTHVPTVPADSILTYLYLDVHKIHTGTKACACLRVHLSSNGMLFFLSWCYLKISEYFVVLHRAMNE